MGKRKTRQGGRGSVVALGYFICCCISFMFSCIRRICLSMPMFMFIVGLAGVDFSCTDAIGVDRASATIEEISAAVFIVVFPLGLNKCMLPLLVARVIPLAIVFTGQARMTNC